MSPREVAIKSLIAHGYTRERAEAEVAAVEARAAVTANATEVRKRRRAMKVVPR